MLEIKSSFELWNWIYRKVYMSDQWESHLSLVSEFDGCGQSNVKNLRVH